LRKGQFHIRAFMRRFYFSFFHFLFDIEANKVYQEFLP
jgi:hypothetical protein